MYPISKKKFSEKIYGEGKYLLLNNNIMKKVIRLTESDLTRIVNQIINEQLARSPQKGNKKLNPAIEIDCVNRVIVSSQLPKLDATANLTIINHYCNK